MLKLWKKIRGYKRQASAVILVLYFVLDEAGVQIPEEIKSNIGLIGSLVFGIGWLDKMMLLPKGGKE